MIDELFLLFLLSEGGGGRLSSMRYAQHFKINKITTNIKQTHFFVENILQYMSRQIVIVKKRRFKPTTKLRKTRVCVFVCVCSLVRSVRFYLYNVETRRNGNEQQHLQQLPIDGSNLMS